ncbi:hypothetical protein OG349_15215 [Streptomyces sp. NBC_01317]|uniref:hypothetical protein n=1 Tax=Streptomyces sp. NBC_01317 TaxID=2903822 RepID=UPI002E11313A|nr:hypothetical protein OG349_15215 [Streptomyces sp. NBC_01317]
MRARGKGGRLGRLPLFDGRPAIAVLEVDLGLPWDAPAHGDRPVLLGDRPVDRRGTVLGDAVALDHRTGADHASTNGLADLLCWGGHAKAAHTRFGGELVPPHGTGPPDHARTRSRRPDGPALDRPAVRPGRRQRRPISAARGSTGGSAPAT